MLTLDSTGSATFGSPAMTLFRFDPEDASSSAVAGAAGSFASTLPTGSNSGFVGAGKIVWRDIDLTSLPGGGEAIDFQLTGLPASTRVKVWSMPLGTKWSVSGPYTPNLFQ